MAQIFHQWRDGKLKVTTNPGVLAQFDRRKLTADLAKVLDRISLPG